MNVGGPVNLTATGQVKEGGGALVGFYVNSTSAGTIVFHDAATGGTNAISGTITPAIGWHFFPVKFGAGLRVVIGGTLNVTFIVAR